MSINDLDPDEALKALIEDFTTHFIKWLDSDRNKFDEPTAMDYPELRDEEIAAARSDARIRWAS